MAFNPYDMLEVYTKQLELSSRTKQDKYQKSTDAQKKLILNRWEQAKKDAEAKAKDKSGMFDEISDLLSGIGTLIANPIAKVALSAAGSILDTSGKRKGMKELEKMPFEKFGKTFLKDLVEYDKKEAESRQVDAGDFLENIWSDVTSDLVMSSAIEGADLGKSIIGGIKEPGKKIFRDQLKESFNPMDMIKRGLDKTSDIKGTVDALKEQIGLGDIEEILKQIDLIKGQSDLQSLQSLGISFGDRDYRSNAISQDSIINRLLSQTR